MSIATESYADIHERYVNAVKWMAEIGVKLGPNRLAHYDKVVGTWKDKYRTATEAEGRDVFPDFVSSRNEFEIHDFVDVYLAFNSLPREALKSIIAKLNKAVNGPITRLMRHPRVLRRETTCSRRPQRRDLDDQSPTSKRLWTQSQTPAFA